MKAVPYVDSTAWGAGLITCTAHLEVSWVSYAARMLGLCSSHDRFPHLRSPSNIERLLDNEVMNTTKESSVITRKLSGTKT